MNNQLRVLTAVKRAIEHLRQSHSNVAMSLLEGIQQDLERHLTNSARYEVARIAAIDEKSMERAVMESIGKQEIGDKPIEEMSADEFDTLFDKVLVALQGFKDAQEALKS